MSKDAEDKIKELMERFVLIENLFICDQERFDTCEDKRTLPHLCPYRSDVHGDKATLCSCCNDCSAECAAKI